MPRTHSREDNRVTAIDWNVTRLGKEPFSTFTFTLLGNKKRSRSGRKRSQVSWLLIKNNSINWRSWKHSKRQGSKHEGFQSYLQKAGKARFELTTFLPPYLTRLPTKFRTLILPVFKFILALFSTVPKPRNFPPRFMTQSRYLRKDIMVYWRPPLAQVGKTELCEGTKAEKEEENLRSFGSRSIPNSFTYRN